MDDNQATIELAEQPMAAQSEGDGEPCPHCQKKLDRFRARRDESGNLLIAVNVKIPAEIVASEVDGLCHLIQAFVYGLGGKPKTSEEKERPRRKRKGV